MCTWYYHAYLTYLKMYYDVYVTYLQESDIRSGNFTSVATYTPRTELDFGTLVRFNHSEY